MPMNSSVNAGAFIGSGGGGGGEELTAAIFSAMAATVGMGIPYATAAALAAASVPVAAQSIELSGYSAAFDGGGHVRKRGISSDPGAIQSADGAWWAYVPVNGREVHAKHFGARFNGSTDDTAAINNAISALTAISGSFTPAASYQLIFPAGRAITQGGHIIPDTIKVDVIGAGRYATILYLKNNSNTFLLEVSGSYGAARMMTLDGNRNNNTTGTECLIVSGSYVKSDDLFITNANGDGIAVGKGDSAINSRFSNIDVRFCKGYGVNIYPSTGSTDCQWTDVNVGQSGMSGFNIGTGAQKMVNCHSWGNGIEHATDNHGYKHMSGGSMLSGCEAETNLGRGHYIGSGLKGITINGGTIWGNCGNGIYATGSTHCTFTGIAIHDNGSSNGAGSSSLSFANIMIDNCQNMTTVGNDMYDTGNAIAAGSYSAAPTYPFNGRSAATFTVTRHYAEGSGSNKNIIGNNQMPAAQSRTGVAITNVGVANRYYGNETGVTTIPTQGSSATLTFNAENDIINITGNTAITTITAGYIGRRVTLMFTTVCTITNGNNIKLGADFTSTAGGTITLVCDGTNWYKA